MTAKTKVSDVIYWFTVLCNVTKGPGEQKLAALAIFLNLNFFSKDLKHLYIFNCCHSSVNLKNDPSDQYDSTADTKFLNQRLQKHMQIVIATENFGITESESGYNLAKISTRLG